jgi:hypothetical protein
MTRKKPRAKRPSRRQPRPSGPAGRANPARASAAPSRRTSTRRMPPSRAATAPPHAVGTAPAAQPGFTARAVAGATLQVTLDLIDVSGRPLDDPETFFTFRRLAANRQVGDQVAMALTGTAPAFDVPAFVGEVLVCDIDPKRFRFVQSPVFFATPGPPIRKTSQLLREPAEWTARFTRWQDLPGSFTDLKTALGRSLVVTHFKDGAPIGGPLVGATYDGLAGEPLVLAKAALLNAYSRLGRMMEPISGARSWFSFIERIIAIGRERFLAVVDPQMEALVRLIDEHIGQFSAEYEKTPAGNHRGNVPVAMQGRIASMVSIKSTDRTGNVQLTMTRLTGPDEVLLDCDIDENGELLKHTLDLLRHKFSGGTHPYDIHELLLLQAGEDAGVDLGYRLE